jgi:preprotein translocase subunit SecE
VTDEHDDATGIKVAAAEDAKVARPSGKRSGRSRSRTALAEVGDVSAATTTVVASRDAKPLKGAKAERGGFNPFAAVWLYLRQVVAELRKVIWPTRSQMVNYTIIVTVFVVLLTAFVSGLDIGFAKLMLWAFG